MEEGTTIGEVDWEVEPNDESASVRVGIAEREDNRSVVALREKWEAIEEEGRKNGEEEEDERVVESESEIENWEALVGNSSFSEGLPFPLLSY